MKATLLADIAFRKTIINQVDSLAEFVLPHAEIVRLYISMQVLPVVDELHEPEYFNT